MVASPPLANDILLDGHVPSADNGQPMSGPSPTSRVLGSRIGVAIGDAVGHRFEGRKPPIEFEAPESFVFSDDTQLTLATCEAILDARGPDPEAIARRFVAWFEAGRVTGLGASTLKALRDRSGAPDRGRRRLRVVPSRTGLHGFQRRFGRRLCVLRNSSPRPNVCWRRFRLIRRALEIAVASRLVLDVAREQQRLDPLAVLC